MRPLAFLLLALLALLAPLPGRAEAEFSSFDEEVGGIRLGLTAAEVKAVLGAPASKAEWVVEEATGMEVQEWSFPARGFTLLMAREDAQDPSHLDRFWVEAPCREATSQGIRLGDGAQKVRKAYAGLLDPEESTADLLVVGSVYDGVLFTLEGGKVTRIFVGAAAE